MCRNDAAREEVLRDHQDKSLLSKKDETLEICTGQDFHLLQTWSLPSTGGKHKGCQHWSECCDSAGQPRCRTYRREDEGRVSRSHSTRKQLPGQSAGLSGYSQLIPTPPEEGYAPDPFLLQGICSEKGWDIPHLYKPPPIFRGIVTHHSTAQPHGQHSGQSREHQHKSISHL